MRNILKNLLPILQFIRRLHCQTDGRKLKTSPWVVALGWSFALGWMLLMGMVSWVVFSGRKDAVEIIMALVETVPLWAIALGVLAVAFMKGNRKASRSLIRPKTNNKTKTK